MEKIGSAFLGVTSPATGAWTPGSRSRRSRRMIAWSRPSRKDRPWRISHNPSKSPRKGPEAPEWVADTTIPFSDGDQQCAGPSADMTAIPPGGAVAGFSKRGAPASCTRARYAGEFPWGVICGCRRRGGRKLPRGAWAGGGSSGGAAGKGGTRKGCRTSQPRPSRGQGKRSGGNGFHDPMFIQVPTWAGPTATVNSRIRGLRRAKLEKRHAGPRHAPGREKL